jgi:hypothetical protein
VELFSLAEQENCIGYPCARPKKKNLGASKTIAVAASGFSAEAARVARENAIDLRVLDEITEEDIKGWMPLRWLFHLFKDCGLTGPPQVMLVAEPGDEAGEATSGSCAEHVFRGPSEEPLSLNDIWLRADDQGKLFDKVPMDNNDHFINLHVTPSDNLQLCTPKGNRRVGSITLPLRLRWKLESMRLSDAKIIRYEPADPADPFPEQVRVEFETKQGTSNNVRLGVQLQQGDAMARVSVAIVPKNE